MNKNSESIILFDSISDSDDLDHMISNDVLKIISFDYDTHKILKDKKINHEISDSFLSKSDLKIIQKTAYSLSEWYNADVISKDVYYKGVNLGSLVKGELINILVNYIKKFFELYKISKQFDDFTFIGSETCCKIMKNFLKKTIKFPNSKTKNSQQFPLDLIKIKMQIGIKNHSKEFGISKNLFKKLKSVSEKSSKLLLSKNSSIDETSKNVLIMEYDPIKYQSFFEQMPNSNLNFLIYNRRRPAIWNFQSYSLIKGSGCFIETENSLSNPNLKEIISNGRFQTETKMSDLFSKESFFKSFFLYRGNLILANFQRIFSGILSKKSS